MSLRDAVQQVVNDMEENEYAVESVFLSPYIKMLKLALKASEGEQQTQKVKNSIPTEEDMLRDLAIHNPAGYHRYMIDKAKSEASKDKPRDVEKNAEEMVACYDGPLDGLMIPIASAIPIDAHFEPRESPGFVYTRKADGIHWNKEQSIKPQKVK